MLGDFKFFDKLLDVGGLRALLTDVVIVCHNGTPFARKRNMKRIVFTALYVFAVIALAYAVAGCATTPTSSWDTTTPTRLPLERSVVTPPAALGDVTFRNLDQNPPPLDHAIRYRYDQPPSVVLGPDLTRREHIRSYTYTSEYDNVTNANGFVSDYSSWRRWNWTVQRTDQQY